MERFESMGLAVGTDRARSRRAPSGAPVSPAGRTAGVSGILLIEDVPETLSAAKLMLEREHFVVLTAMNGLEGVETFCRHERDIDVVLVDLVIPELDGVDTLRAIRDLQDNAKVILTTGYEGHPAPDRWRALGFAGFIKKPYTADRLMTEIRAVMGT